MTNKDFLVYDHKHKGFICHQNKKSVIADDLLPELNYRNDKSDYIVYDKCTYISMDLLKRLGWPKNFRLDPKKYYYLKDIKA